MSARFDHIRCGFCNARASESKDIFVSGIDANICEGCVTDAVCIISRKRRANPQTTSMSPEPPPRVA